MSNFVNNLIERHTQTESNVQPRVRGRFEADRTPTASFVVDSGPERDSSTSNPFPDRQQEPFSWANQRLTRQQPTDQSLSKSTDPNQSPAAPLSARITNPEPLHGPTQPAHPADFAVQNTALNPMNTRLTAVPYQAPSQPTRLGGIASLRADDQPDGTVRPALGKVPATDTDWPGARRGGLLSDPVRLLDRRQNNPERQADQVPALPAQPIIKVTIGRIDVRAMPAPSPVTAQPRTGPKPQLSLEEYLKQRNNRPK